ncbi:MAG: lysine--tRNA ligase [Polyangiaceae bacterium]|nr:lysine--tRNA ligase [Polyangiaceae bacterium]
MTDPNEIGAEDALIQARRTKAERLRARGESPFPNDLEPGDRSRARDLRALAAPALVDEAGERYDPARVTELAGAGDRRVLGRVLARRGFGKAAFLRLRDGTGELQLFCRIDSMGEAFARLEDLDVGDHVEAAGPLMVTRAGELSIEVRRLRVVSKALRPLPDKWHGLTDVDERYRRRYVDLVANPSAAIALRARSLIVQALRAFLDGRGFLEVETPTLHALVGGAAAKPFKTHHNALELELFLRIAPELHLKRLLVGGFERVYEIGRAYRNEGLSTRHNPEFTILEYYQAYATYVELMDQTEELLRDVDQRVTAAMHAAGLGPAWAALVDARPFTIAEPFARLPMREGVDRALRAAGLPRDVPARLPELALPEPTSTGAEAARARGDALTRELARASARAGRVDWASFRRGLAACDTEGERLFSAYEYLVEPFLAEDFRSEDGARSRPVFVVDYPAEVSPLARRKDSDPTLVDRFELFVHGRELCNAFSELNDPDDQAARFRDQVEKKARGAEETMDFDADYVRALEHGMPPAAGFGLGVDRLVMALASQASIRDVIAFPLLRPESP